MIYIKTYCYSDHELPFIVAQLEEAYDFIDMLYVFEYNYTHTGIKKDYNFERVIQHVPDRLKDKLCYKKVNLDGIVEYAYENEPLIHALNEPVQRSMFFNDPSITLNDDDIIIDIDSDEIIYKQCYTDLLSELNRKNRVLSIKFNQFFFKHNFLWTNIKFSSPTIYKYGMVKGISRKIKCLSIKHQRDCAVTTDGIYGCHMSWVMPAKYMVKKLHSYGHPKYRKFADENVLQKAIDNKEYIFDSGRKMEIDVLDLEDIRIPTHLRGVKNIFEYM